ncbi:hypothetical protein Ssi03_25480 [Sphaerisporangium siamense]|uniref:Uncharacterized protein n=1 Tax=Sphaerisporangium siamense TaxID=795645 RepID=A0A7W7D4F3_9ACTN|nr:hypothetical protein [Sphaerisporangium siamense]MBB4700127.1 hypothetical protein [Sphaerisporangium siamense]GII84558.1 hypothetical protein Ssi03_25480 [Sphaerisporangium siamense]
MSTPQQRSTAARIAVNISWSRTPVRAERTRPATEANRGQLAYWERVIREEGIVCEEEIPLAAASRRSAYMSQLAKNAAASRKAKKNDITPRARRIRRSA